LGGVRNPFFTKKINISGKSIQKPYKVKALDGTQSLTARLNIYKNKSIYHRNVSLSKIKLLKSQKAILTCVEN